MDPNNARTHVLYGLHFVGLGMNDQAMAQFQRALQLEPLNLNANTNLGAAYFNVKLYDQSEAQLKKTLEIDPNYASAHQFLSFTYQVQGKYDLWLEEAQKGANLDNDAEEIAFVKAVSLEYNKAGYHAAMKRAAEFQEEQAKRVYVDPAYIAITYATLGDKDKTFLWLEKAFTERSDGLRVLKTNPNFDSVRADRRYADLLRRMNLPQ